MSRICPLTGKHPVSGNNRSHSLRATRRKWNVNLQKATIIVDGKPTTIRCSTKALRTLRKNQKNINAEAKAAAPTIQAEVAEPTTATAE